MPRRDAKPSRRSFLQLGLTAAAALPLLSAVKRARGGVRAAGSVQRLVLFPSLNGSPADLFWPNPGQLGNLSPILEPLKPWASKMTFVRGMNIEGSYDHFAVRSMFTGAPITDYLGADPTVPSLDQVVADRFQEVAPASLRSLHLGAIPADSIDFYQKFGRSTFFFKQGPLHYEANPVTAFDSVFGDLGEGPTTQPGPNFEKDVVGITTAEIGTLKGRLAGSPREAQKLGFHQGAIANLGQDVDVETPQTCSSAELPSVAALRGSLQGNAAAAYNSAYYEGIINAQVDIIARALTCGLTRVATLQAGSADGNVTVPVGGGLPHHLTSHGPGPTFALVQNWYAGKVARLCQALDVDDPLDPGRKVLDNTVILWMSECKPSHDSTDVPCFFIGGAGNQLKTSTYVNANGATNRTLLNTLARALGAPDSASAHFGGQVISEVLL